MAAGAALICFRDLGADLGPKSVAFEQFALGAATNLGPVEWLKLAVDSYELQVVGGRECGSAQWQFSGRWPCEFHARPPVARARR